MIGRRPIDDDDDDDDDVELNVLGCRFFILGTNCDQCLSMVQCCFTSTETTRLIRTGSPGRPPRFFSRQLLNSAAFIDTDELVQMIGGLIDR